MAKAFAAFAFAVALSFFFSFFFIVFIVIVAEGFFAADFARLAFGLAAALRAWSGEEDAFGIEKNCATVDEGRALNFAPCDLI